MIIIGIVPDLHAPLEDKRAFGVACNALADQRLKRVVQLGDLADMETLSMHGRNKPSATTLEHERKGVIKVRKDLESLAPERFITLGNHEDRVGRFLMKHAPELFDTVNFKSLFGFNGWHITPFKSHLQMGKMVLTHCIDPLMTGINAVRESGKIAGTSIVIGHVHRGQTEYHGKITGKRYVAHCPGWLGSLKAAEYISKAKIYSQWMLDFTIGYLEENGHMTLQHVPILEGAKCVVGGKLYRA